MGNIGSEVSRSLKWTARGNQQRADKEFAGDHDDDRNGRCKAHLGESDQRRKDQYLVGDRIEEFAEIGDEIPAAGNVSVQRVGDRRSCKDDERPDAV